MRPLSRRGLFALACAGGAAILTACTRGGRTVEANTTSTPSLAVTPVSTTSATPTPTVTTPTPTPSPSPTGPAVEVGRGPSTRAEVALTFHGAGDPALARTLLALLAARGVKVTVFAVGTWLAANPSMAEAVLAGGHELANHTWSHPTLSDLNEAAVRAEIARCRDQLVSLTGGPGSYFRQSAAQNSTPLIRAVAGELGYRTCLSYDVDSLDWTDPGTAAVRRATATARAGSIVSMHLGHQVTIDALPSILDDLAGRGLTPVTASRLLAA